MVGWSITQIENKIIYLFICFGCLRKKPTQNTMASKFNSFGYITEEAPDQQDSTVVSSFTADMRAELTQPDDGMICFDPDSKGLLYWNGLAWVTVITSAVVSSRTIVTVTADYAMDTVTDVVVVNANSGPITVTLPLVSAMKGRDIAVVKSDGSSNIVTLMSQGSDVIGDVADTTFALSSQHSMVRLMSADSGIWYCV